MPDLITIFWVIADSCKKAGKTKTGIRNNVKCNPRRHEIMMALFSLSISTLGHSATAPPSNYWKSCWCSCSRTWPTSVSSTASRSFHRPLLARSRCKMKSRQSKLRSPPNKCSCFGCDHRDRRTHTILSILSLWVWWRRAQDFASKCVSLRAYKWCPCASTLTSLKTDFEKNSCATTGTNASIRNEIAGKTALKSFQKEYRPP